MNSVSRIAYTAGPEMAYQVLIDQLTQGSVMEAIALAKQEIAKKIWEENQDKIMASMDLKGLANLIAVFAAKRIAEDMKNG